MVSPGAWNQVYKLQYFVNENTHEEHSGQEQIESCFPSGGGKKKGKRKQVISNKRRKTDLPTEAEKPHTKNC